MKTKNNTISLDQFVENHYGKIGTKKRDSFEKGYENFKLDIPKIILSLII